MTVIRPLTAIFTAIKQKRLRNRQLMAPNTAKSSNSSNVLSEQILNDSIKVADEILSHLNKGWIEKFDETLDFIKPSQPNSMESSQMLEFFQRQLSHSLSGFGSALMYFRLKVLLTRLIVLKLSFVKDNGEEKQLSVTIAHELISFLDKNLANESFAMLNTLQAFTLDQIKMLDINQIKNLDDYSLSMLCSRLTKHLTETIVTREFEFDSELESLAEFAQKHVNSTNFHKALLQSITRIMKHYMNRVMNVWSNHPEKTLFEACNVLKEQLPDTEEMYKFCAQIQDSKFDEDERNILSNLTKLDHDYLKSVLNELWV